MSQKSAHALIQGPWRELEPKAKPDPVSDVHRALAYMGLILGTILVFLAVGYGMGKQHVNGPAMDKYIAAANRYAYGANALSASCWLDRQQARWKEATRKPLKVRR